MLAKRNGATRKFDGPFLILGISPHWPKELDRRKDGGILSGLADMRPVAALQAIEETRGRIVAQARDRGLLKPYAPPAVQAREKLVKVAPTHKKDLAKPLGAKFIAALEKIADFVNGRPRTAKQAARHAGVSEPTVYAILDVLERKGFPLRKEKREGKRAAMWSLAYPEAKAPKARA